MAPNRITDQPDGTIQNTIPTRWLQTEYLTFLSLFPAAASARSCDLRWFIETNQMASYRIPDQPDGSKPNIRYFLLSFLQQLCPVMWAQWFIETNQMASYRIPDQSDDSKPNIPYFLLSFLQQLLPGHVIFWDQSDGSTQNTRPIRWLQTNIRHLPLSFLHQLWPCHMICWYQSE